MDSCRIERTTTSPQSLIESAERGTAVPRDESGCVEPGVTIAMTLKQQQPHERLDSGNEHWIRVDAIAVGKAVDLTKLHVHDEFTLTDRETRSTHRCMA